MKILKINNSKDAAVGTSSSSHWKNPGAKFYDTLMDSWYFFDDEDPDNPNNLYPAHYLKEAYLIAPIDSIKNSPYGRTPYSRSGCKYPHHAIRGDELVVHMVGLKAAYARAKQHNVFKGDIRDHIVRHFRDLEMEDYIERMEEIDENFNFIESYISEAKDNILVIPNSQLPPEISKVVKDLQNSIISKIKHLLSRDNKYELLKDKKIIDEIINANKKEGKTYITKKPKSYIGSIHITRGSQSFSFYDGGEKYKTYIKLLKEVEDELGEFNELPKENKGMKFKLLGDPMDQIHEFELELNNDLFDMIWDYNKGNKVYTESTNSSFYRFDELLSIYRNEELTPEERSDKFNEATKILLHSLELDDKLSMQFKLDAIYEYLESSILPLNNDMYFEEIFTEDANIENNESENTKSPSVENLETEGSMPEQTDKAESPANGKKRKELYMAFIEHAKGVSQKNTFGSVFDKDAFQELYKFVPHEMRYFYRLANPLLCVLREELTFFALSELKKVNSSNIHIDKLVIFAGTTDKVIVFNTTDKAIYESNEEELKTGKVSKKISNSFDEYLESIVGAKYI